jgi:hypothetical protein
LDRPRILAALCTALVVGLLWGGLSAGAEPGATVLDRTVECRTLLNGGIYEIEVRGHAGVRESKNVWKTLPFAVVTSGNTGSAATQLDNAYVWISAGRPTRETWLEEHFFPTLALANGTMAIKLGRCRSTRASVPLSRRGLNGGAAGGLGDTYDCEAPRNVLVRVRARLEGSAGLRTHDGYLRTSAPITEAAFAVRTRSGKPLAYASVAASGKTQLFTGTGCFRD